MNEEEAREIDILLKTLNAAILSKLVVVEYQICENKETGDQYLNIVFNYKDGDPICYASDRSGEWKNYGVEDLLEYLNMVIELQKVK